MVYKCAPKQVRDKLCKDVAIYATVGLMRFLSRASFEMTVQRKNRSDGDYVSVSAGFFLPFGGTSPVCLSLSKR